MIWENKGRGEAHFGCPFEACHFNDNRRTVVHHVERYHNHEKWMCPIGLVRHVVPIIAVTKKTIEIHINDAHPHMNLQPIMIHSKQINFPFTMPYKNSADKLKLSELCFVEQRRAAKEYIYKNEIQEAEGNKWLTIANIADRLKDEVPIMLKGIKEDITLATDPLYDVTEEEVTHTTKKQKV